MPVVLAVASQRRQVKDTMMVRLAVLFLVIALVAALFGFTTVAGTAYAAAKLLFVVFLVLFIVSIIAGVSRRGAPL